MAFLAAACIGFLVTHLGVSSTPLRPLLVKTIGETPYLACYSVLALVSLGAMIVGYASLEHHLYVWLPSLALTLLAKCLMPVALVFLLLGLMTRNPTAVKMQELVGAATGLKMPGILKITRHPIQWAILLWALAHLIANGDQASILFFGTFALLAGLGPVLLDRRLTQLDTPDWRQFYAMTSNVPFVGLLRGKSQLSLSDINWVAVIMGLSFYVIIYYFHGLLAGVSLL